MISSKTWANPPLSQWASIFQNAAWRASLQILWCRQPLMHTHSASTSSLPVASFLLFLESLRLPSAHYHRVYMQPPLTHIPGSGMSLVLPTTVTGTGMGMRNKLIQSDGILWLELEGLGKRTVVLEKILESSLDCKEIKPVTPKGNEPWVFIGRTDAEPELQSFGHQGWRSNSLEKAMMPGKTEGEKRKAEQSMRWLDSITNSMRNLTKLSSWLKTGLVRCGPWGHRSWTWPSDWATTTTEGKRGQRPAGLTVWRRCGWPQSGMVLRAEPRAERSQWHCLSPSVLLTGLPFESIHCLSLPKVVYIGFLSLIILKILINKMSIAHWLLKTSWSLHLK